MGSNPVLSRTGESLYLSEALILASINPKYDDKLFVELQFCASSVHVMYIKLHKTSTSLCVAKMCAQNEITSLQIEGKNESHSGALRNKILVFFLIHC